MIAGEGTPWPRWALAQAPSQSFFSSSRPQESSSRFTSAQRSRGGQWLEAGKAREGMPCREEPRAECSLCTGSGGARQAHTHTHTHTHTHLRLQGRHRPDLQGRPGEEEQAGQRFIPRGGKKEASDASCCFTGAARYGMELTALEAAPAHISYKRESAPEAASDDHDGHDQQPAQRLTQIIPHKVIILSQ